MARALSLLVAIVGTLVIMTAPFLLVRQMTGFAHMVAPFLMAGIMMAFTHGLGYSPRHRALQPLASPWLAWPLIGGATWLLLVH